MKLEITVKSELGTRNITIDSDDLGFLLSDMIGNDVTNRQVIYSDDYEIDPDSVQKSGTNIVDFLTKESIPSVNTTNYKPEYKYVWWWWNALTNDEKRELIRNNDPHLLESTSDGKPMHSISIKTIVKYQKL